jgi:hypothetical protein
MGKPEAKRSASTDCCGGYAHVLIHPTIIKETAVAVAHERSTLLVWGSALLLDPLVGDDGLYDFD